MLAPGEIQILKTLKREMEKERGIYVAGKKLLEGLSFTDLKEQTGLSSSVLSAYLKNLQKVKAIERDIDTRRYILTEDVGKIFLKIVSISEILDKFANKLNEYSKEDLKKIDDILTQFHKICVSEIL